MAPVSEKATLLVAEVATGLFKAESSGLLEYIEELENAVAKLSTEKQAYRGLLSEVLRRRALPSNQQREIREYLKETK